MRHLHVPDRPDEPTPEHSVRPNPDRPDRQCKCGRLAPSRSTFSNEIDGGAVDLVRGSRPRRVSPVRTATDLDAEVDRSRHGLRPISRRSTTGPMAERGGFEPPVRQAHSGFQDRHIRPLCHLSMPAQPLEPLDAHAGDPTLPPPPRCATPWPMRASRLNRLSRINGIGRADRRQPREKNPRLRVGLADAGTGEAGLSRRPSAKACAIAGHTGRRGMSVACRAW